MKTAQLARREQRLAGTEEQPPLGSGECYVTGGAAFHTGWCSAVNGVWLSGAEDPVRVVPREEAERGKRPCSLCVAEERPADAEVERLVRAMMGGVAPEELVERVVRAQIRALDALVELLDERGQESTRLGAAKAIMTVSENVAEVLGKLREGRL